MKRKRITMTKRILVAMLCLVTIFTCIPMSAFADEASKNVEVQSEDPLSIEEEIETTDEIALEETLEEVTLEEVSEEISEEIIVEQQEEIIEEEIIDETLNDVTESEASELPEENLPSPIKSKMLAAPLGAGEPKVYNIYINYVGSLKDEGLYKGPKEASANDHISFVIADTSFFPIDYISVTNSKNEEIIKFDPPSTLNDFIMPNDDIYINIYKVGNQNRDHNIYTKSEGAGQVMASTSSAGAGETFTVTQQANNGNKFDYFEVDGTKYYESPLTLTMGDRDITVVGHFSSLYSPTVSTSVTPLEAGTITITGDTTTPGSICDVKVTANPGYIYDHLVIKYGNSTVTKTSSSFPYIIPSTNNNITFTAYFKNQVNIGSFVTPFNSGIIEGVNEHAKPGEVLKLNAVANPGYTFNSMIINWGNHKETIRSNSYDFTVPDTNDTIVITASFTQERWFLSTHAPTGGGRATLTKYSLYYDETSFFEAIPNEGWKLKEVSWIYDGKRITCNDQNIKFTAREELPKDTVINVEFERVYKITAISDPAEGGTIKLSHNEATKGETVNVTVNANPGYKIVDIIPEGTAPFSTKHVNDNTYEFSFKMANRDLKFKVSYEKITPVNVTFDANGASGTMDIVKVLPNEEITLPVNTFERDGYSFDEWDINGTSYKAGDKVKVTADIAVKAMWLINAYELTFDTNYPEANLKPVVIVNGKIHVDTIDFNTEFSIGVNDFDNENYAIDKVLVDNAKVTLTDNSFSYTMPSHDVKIEVNFVKKLSVSFDANGASGSIDSFKVIPNEEITLPANTFVRDGYSFDGWSINDASYKAGEKVKVTSDIVVKANWKVNSYNLTFESNYNEANLKPIVILKGKDFNGKVDFDDEFLLNLYNYDKENYQIVKTTFDGKEIDNDLSKVYKMPSHDAKIVVTFVKKLVVTFDANGGKGSIDTLKVMPNEEITLPKNSFTRSGYTFKGWDIDGKTYKVNDTVVIEKDTTIKAKWSKNPDPAPTNDDNNNNDSNNSGNNSNSSSSQGSDTKKAETAAVPATVTSSQAKNTSSKVTTDEAVTSNENTEEDNDSKVETKESKDEETKEVSKSDDEDQPASLAITDGNVPEGNSNSNSNTNTNTNEPETDNTDDGISALELVGIISAFIIALLALIVTVSASVRRRRK